MNTEYLPTLLDYLREQHPRSVRGVEEAIAISPADFKPIAEMFLEWLVKARGENALRVAADAFAQFLTEVNMAQAQYEADGHYAHQSFAEVYDAHYSDDSIMESYLLGIYLTNFLWAHHTEICLFYRDYFLKRLSADSELVEIAPGHGGWGTWALSVLPKAHLKGFDISPASIGIATGVSGAAGFSDRATYQLRDALDLQQLTPESADAVICSFVIEHLEKPAQLFAVVHHLLKPRGLGFITGALTAAQVDHIYEFRYESELIKMCEEHGLRLIGSLSVGPKRTFRNAQFLPRSMALIVQKRITETF